jgi:hypothetical protein
MNGLFMHQVMQPLSSHISHSIYRELKSLSPRLRNIGDLSSSVAFELLNLGIHSKGRFGLGFGGKGIPRPRIERYSLAAY